MKKLVGYKPQWTEFNYCMRPLHEVMICVHSITFWKIVGQAKYKKYQSKFHNIEFQRRNHYWRWSSTQRDKNHCTLKPKTIPVQADSYRSSKCLHRAQQKVYWLGLYDQIHVLITNSQTCLKSSNTNHKQPPIMTQHNSFNKAIPYRTPTESQTHPQEIYRRS